MPPRPLEDREITRSQAAKADRFPRHAALDRPLERHVALRHTQTRSELFRVLSIPGEDGQSRQEIRPDGIAARRGIAGDVRQPLDGLAIKSGFMLGRAGRPKREAVGKRATPAGPRRPGPTAASNPQVVLNRNTAKYCANASSNSPAASRSRPLR